MPKVTLGKAVRYPFGSRVVHPSGTVLEVSAEDEQRLRELGVVAVGKPASVEPAAPTPAPDVAPDSEVEDRVGNKFAPLPKKSQGINVWREYAREHDIDVRGLSEKSELMGHIINIVSSQ